MLFLDWVIHGARWTEKSHIKHDNSTVVLHLSSHSADQKYPQCYQPLTCVSMQIYSKTWQHLNISLLQNKYTQPGFHWPPVLLLVLMVNI